MRFQCKECKQFFGRLVNGDICIECTRKPKIQKKYKDNFELAYYEYYLGGKK